MISINSSTASTIADAFAAAVPPTALGVAVSVKVVTLVLLW